MALDAGTVEATLRIRDEFTAVVDKVVKRVDALERQFTQLSRSTKRDSDQLARSYHKLSADLDPVVKRTQQYDRAVDILTRSLKAGNLTQAQYNHQLGLARAKFLDASTGAHRLSTSISSQLMGSFTSFLATTALVTGALGAIISVTKQTVKANIDAEVSSRRVEEAVRRHGATSGISAGQINDTADAISRLTGIDDELIADAQTIAVRFNRIGAEILPRVTQAAVDLSTATGRDLSASMEKVGKLINQPLKALTLLGREGYAVAASQDHLIKSLVAAGKIQEAQIEILKIIESQYQGAAVAARDTMGGALQALGTTWENFLERVGQDNMGPLRQALESLISLLQTATDGVKYFENGFHSLRAAVNIFVMEALRGIANVADAISQAGPLFGALGILSKKVADAGRVAAIARGGAAAAEKNASDSAAALAKSLLGLGSSHKASAGAALEQTDAESKLADQLTRVRDIAQEAVEASRLQLQNSNALLAARRIGVDAMKLEEGIQRALTRARAAGEAATSSQRLEIIRNYLAADIAKNRTDALAESQRSLADNFKEVESELVKITAMLDEFVRLLDEMDRTTLDFSVNINREQVELGGAQATATTRERVDFANEWRESWRTAREVAEREIKRVQNSILTLAEKERAVADIREHMVLETVSQWQEGLNTLANLFGGFFAKLADGVQQLMASYQSFSAMGKASGMGSAASSLGWFGVFVAVVDIAHSLYKAHRENQRNRQFMLSASAAGQRDRSGEWQISAAQDTRLNIIKASRDASNAIYESMEEMTRAFGGVIKTFESIQINIRRDGKYFEAIVGNELLGVYGSFEEAMEAALHASLLAAETVITGLSELVQEGLAALQAGEIGRTSSLDQVVDFLSALKEISELGMPEGALRIQEFTRHLDELWRQMRRMNEVTPAVAQGFTNLLEAEISSWQAWSREIRGVQQTPQELLAERKREAEMFNAQKKLRIAELQLKVLELKADAERLRARGQIVRGGALINQGEINTGIAYIQAKTSLVKADADITQQYIDFINAVIEAINAVIAELEKIPEIDVDKLKLPRVGGVGSDRDQVRDFIADRRFEISTRGMTDWQRAVAELDRTYAPMIEQAGKDIKLRQQVIALKEEELRLLAQEAARSTVASFREFLGLVTPFEQARNTTADLIRDIEGSPFGDARKARMIGRVMEDLEKQIERLSMQEASALFGDMIGRMEALGATDAQLAESRRHLAVLEHTLALDNYRTRIEALRLEGKLAPGVIAALDASLAWLDAQTQRIIQNAGVIDDGRRFRGYDDAPVTNVIDAADRFNDALRKATELLDKYRTDGLDPLRRSLVDITRDFSQIRSTLGDTPEVMLQYAGAVKRAIDDFLDPVRQVQRDLFFGEDSPASVEQQWQRIQRDLAGAEARFRAGDLRAVEEITNLVPEFTRLGRLMSPLGSQGFWKNVYEPANDLLNEVLSLQIDDLGTAGNPLSVNGINDLTLLTEAQVEKLEVLYRVNVRAADALEEINAKTSYQQNITGLKGVA